MAEKENIYGGDTEFKAWYFWVVYRGNMNVEHHLRCLKEKDTFS